MQFSPLLKKTELIPFAEEVTGLGYNPRAPAPSPHWAPAPPRREGEGGRCPELLWPSRLTGTGHHPWRRAATGEQAGSEAAGGPGQRGEQWGVQWGSLDTPQAGWAPGMTGLGTALLELSPEMGSAP